MVRCKAWLIGWVLLFLPALLPVPARAQGELQLASQAAVLMDAQTGAVLYEKNMHEPLYPASITKLMTALLAMEALEPEQVLTVSQTAVNAVPRTPRPEESPRPAYPFSFCFISAPFCPFYWTRFVVYFL